MQAFACPIPPFLRCSVFRALTTICTFSSVGRATDSCPSIAVPPKAGAIGTLSMFSGASPETVALPTELKVLIQYVLGAVLFVTALTRSVSFPLRNRYLLCVHRCCVIAAPLGFTWYQSLSGIVTLHWLSENPGDSHARKADWLRMTPLTVSSTFPAP